ncbi:MAG: hypothetical protein KC635_28955, partial [Myxococcales bacterium]|nr:hypothetical protein [Myxococcales bacterium]
MMELHVYAPGPVDAGLLRDHVVRRAHSTLARFTDAIRRLSVRLEDENGPRGGVDKRCQVEIVGPDLATVVVEARADAWNRAIERALASARRAVRRR